MSLDKIEVGNKCVISKLNYQSSIAQKLLDMGFVPGTKLKVVRNAPLKDPIKVQIRGYHLAIRKEEAKEVLVERLVD